MKGTEPWKLAGKICGYANMQILKLAGKICGLFFPHSSFSSALPSPSPPSSGQVSRECCSKGCTRGCICLAFLHCVLSNESSNVQMLLMTLLNTWREWNWTKNGSLTIQSLNCLCSHWSSKLCKRCVRNSKIWWRMPLRSDLLQTSQKVNKANIMQGPVSAKLGTVCEMMRLIAKEFLCASDNHDLCWIFWSFWYLPSYDEIPSV